MRGRCLAAPCRRGAGAGRAGGPQGGFTRGGGPLWPGAPLPSFFPGAGSPSPPPLLSHPFPSHFWCWCAHAAAARGVGCSDQAFEPITPSACSSPAPLAHVRAALPPCRPPAGQQPAGQRRAVVGPGAHARLPVQRGARHRHDLWAGRHRGERPLARFLPFLLACLLESLLACLLACSLYRQRVRAAAAPESVLEESTLKEHSEGAEQRAAPQRSSLEGARRPVALAIPPCSLVLLAASRLMLPVSQ